MEVDKVEIDAINVMAEIGRVVRAINEVGMEREIRRGYILCVSPHVFDMWRYNTHPGVSKENVQPCQMFYCGFPIVEKKWLERNSMIMYNPKLTGFYEID